MRVLIVKISSIGDVLQSLDILEYLKKRVSGDLKIDWVVAKGSMAIVKAHPFVRRVILYEGFNKRFLKELRREPYELLFDLQGNIKSGIVTFFARSIKKIGFSFKNVAEWPNCFVTNNKISVDRSLDIRSQYLGLIQNYFGDFEKFYPKKIALEVDEKERERVSDILKKRLKRNFLVLVAPYSKNRCKEVGKEGLLNLLRYMDAKYGCFFMFTSSNEEEEIRSKELSSFFIENSSVLKDMGLPSLYHLAKGVDFAIAMDSSILHLLDISKTPSFSFFGPSSSDMYRPRAPYHFSIQGSCPYGEKFIKRCRFIKRCSCRAIWFENYKVIEEFERFFSEVFQKSVNLTF